MTGGASGNVFAIWDHGKSAGDTANSNSYALIAGLINANAIALGATYFANGDPTGSNSLANITVSGNAFTVVNLIQYNDVSSTFEGEGRAVLTQTFIRTSTANVFYDYSVTGNANVNTLAFSGGAVNDGYVPYEAGTRTFRWFQIKFVVTNTNPDEYDFTLDKFRYTVDKEQTLFSDTIMYDGFVASYTSPTGNFISGESHSLRSAINTGWLKLEGEKLTSQEEENIKVTESNRADYNDKIGGNFDSFMKKENKVIQEKDLIVKSIPTIDKVTENDKKKAKISGKLEVAGDQVSIKGDKKDQSFIVNSSTTVPRNKKHSAVIQESDSFGAESSTPMNLKKVASESTKKNKKKFIVDSTTSNASEDPTLDEINKIKGSNEDHKKPKNIVQVQQDEGVIFKSTDFSKDTKTKVSSGSDPVVDIASSEEVIVVKKANDYSKLLPEDWKSLHWVKKEKWIKLQTDPDLLKYLCSVEDVKAVINACMERLEELAQG